MCGPDMALFPPQLTALSLLWRRGPPPVPGCARCLHAARAASRAVEEARRPPFLPSSEITQRAVFHEIILKTLTARSDSLPSTSLLYSYPKYFSCKWFTSLHLAGKKDMQTQVPELSVPTAAPPPTARPPSSGGGTRPSCSVPGPPDCPGRAPAVREGRSGLTTLTRLFRSRPDLHALGSCSPVSSQPFRFQRWRGTIPV